MAVLEYNAFAAKKIKKDMYTYQEPQRDGTMKVTGIKASLIAEEIAANNIFLYATAPNGSRGTLYRYEQGVYTQIEEKELNRIVYDFIADLDAETMLRPSKIQQVVDLIKIKINTVYYDELNSNIDIINFRNGILKLDTMTLIEHSPDILSTIQIPTNWNPDAAETPVFDYFMDSLTTGIKDAEDVKKLLLQFIGIVISNVPGYKYKTSLLLYGPGGTGKTQYRNLISKLIGEHNTQQMELRDLDRDFVTGGLYGKRMFGSDDMSYAHSRDFSNFKSIVGGGQILISQKFKDSFTTILNGVFINCANDLPLFGGDKGEHVYKRIMPVLITNVVPPEKINRNILNDMMKEAEGICYKAVLALVDTIDRTKNDYHVIIPESVKENWKAYQTANDLAVEFYQTFCFPSDIEDTKYTEAQIRKCFKNWCKMNYNTVPQKDEFERSIAGYLKIGVSALKHRVAAGRYYNFDMMEDCYNDYYYNL